MSEHDGEKEPDGGSGIDSPEEIRRRARPYLGLGSTFLASVAFCIFGGWWLDSKAGSSPWLTVVGALAGIGIGFYLFFKAVLPKDGSGGDWSE